MRRPVVIETPVSSITMAMGMGKKLGAAMDGRKTGVRLGTSAMRLASSNITASSKYIPAGRRSRSYSRTDSASRRIAVNAIHGRSARISTETRGLRRNRAATAVHLPSKAGTAASAMTSDAT